MNYSVLTSELKRNEVIYGYQGNRNPFIDHPEYAERIWGTDPGVGIHNMLQTHFRVYPNPTRDMLTIAFIETGRQTIELTTLNGQVLYRADTEESTYQVELSSYPGGLYLISIKSKAFVTTVKIIKR